MRVPGPAVWILIAALSACGGPERAMRPEDYNTVPVRLPSGKVIRAEQLVQPEELARGMMYRDELPEDRGLIFYHGKPGRYPYWMYQVKVPLDIVWLDGQKRVVQVVHQAPPCPGPQDRCLAYGGAFDALYVLEVRAGVAKANGLRPGAQVEF
ncbi:MAG: DUF192 domain-containing protein [Bryobacteraceae bacterium]|jgi:uncharacterized membrane protein (UPF0127 family)